MNEGSRKKIAVTAAVIILLFSMALRINAPEADLPSHITFSGSILTDEGNQCHNSRSKALYNQWYPDDWRITNYNPVLPYMKYIIFKIFGVGLWQLRLVSFIFAFLSLLFFLLTLRSYFHPHYGPALLGTLLLGINFLYLMYNKIGTFETSIIFWVILTLYFLEKYRSTKKSYFLILTGAAAFTAFVFKSIMAYFLPLPIAACILLCIFPGEKEHPRPPLKEGARSLIFILFGALLVSVPWYLFHYLPNKEWILSAPGKYMGKLMFPKSLETAFHNFLTFNWKDQFYKIPMVWLGALLYIPVFFRRVSDRRATLTETGYTLFFFAHTFVFFVMSYRPTRYFIPVIPVMVFMTVLLFTHFISARPEEKPRVRPFSGGVLYILDTAWLTIASAFCFLPLISRYIYSFPVPAISIKYLLASAVLVALFHFIKNLYRKWVWEKPDFRFLFIPFALLLVVVCMVINLNYYLQWNRDKTFSIRDMSLELGEKLDNAYIGGMTAPAAVLENRHKALWLYPDFVNWDEKTFEKYPLTHALLGTDVSREIHHFFNMWPERMERAKLLKIYHIKNYFLHLYSFIDPYISEGKKRKDNDLQLTVINPSQKIIKTRLGRVTGEEPFKIEKGLREFELSPGENTITIDLKELPQPLPASILFFLDYDHPFAGDKLRYEGENFQGKTGVNIKKTSASHDYVRFFDCTSHAPGFLSYGPAVPYAGGFLIVDFKLTFGNFKTKIRPVCQLDIFSHQANGPVAEQSLRPPDIKKNKTDLYRLHTLLPAAQTLEFRLQATPYADITFDYLDVTYYQGIFIDLKEKEIATD